MKQTEEKKHRRLLEDVAREAMLARGFLVDFSPGAQADLAAISGPAMPGRSDMRDLRSLLWCSVDNDDSLDLDQLTVAEGLPDGTIRVLVAIADVDALVTKGSAIDEHARHNTTSIYTAARIFPMIPERLSTDLTSLNHECDRQAVIVEMVIGEDGMLVKEDLFPALVRNQARLSYNAVALWLDGQGPMPAELAEVRGLDDKLRLQDQAAQRLKVRRHRNGALDFETRQARPVFTGDELSALQDDLKNRAKEIVEEFMIAANGVTARYLTGRQFPSIRREVRTPKRWERIVDLAAERGTTLPSEPNSKALESFLQASKGSDPLRFPDLSLSVIKLLGAGEYVADVPGDEDAGHFGLAVKEYTHSTAPNRRFPDLITQRLLKAAWDGRRCPYEAEELAALAKHCTQAENEAKKVERQVTKAAAALLLESRIGETFDALVTGASAKGTWVRLLEMAIEGRLSSGYAGVEVGQRVRVRLESTDARRGFIDFSLLD